MALQFQAVLSLILFCFLPYEVAGQSLGIDLSLDQFIVQPTSGCGPRNIACVITNQGSTTIAPPIVLPIIFTIDDGVNPVTNGQGVIFNLVPLYPAQPVLIAIPGTITLTQPVTHTITATLVLNGDPSPLNNTTTTPVDGPIPLNVFPWIETFDGLGWNGLGDGSTIAPPCWTNVQGENMWGIGDDWLFRTGATGTPGTGPMGGFSNGTNDFYAFCEDTGSDHNAVELLTPYIDSTGLPGAEVSFWVHSVNALGFGTGENQLHVDLVLYPSGQIVSDIRPPIGHTPGGWTGITVNLNSWIGSIFQVRFRAEMDGGVGMDTHDIAIDSVQVNLSQGIDLQLESIDSPAAGTQLTCSSGSPVSITIRNLGPATLSSGIGLPLSYTVDDGVNTPFTVSEVRQITTSIAAGASLSHTFSGPLSIAPLMTVTMSAAVSLQWDVNTANDTILGHQYTNGGAPSIATFPAIEDFDLTTWTGIGFGTNTPPASCWINVEGENGSTVHDDWYFASGSIGLSTTGPTGDHTSGYGSYAYAAVDNTVTPHTTTLISPSYDVTQLTKPVASFWVHSLNSAGVDARLHIDLLHGASNALLASDIIPPIGSLASNNWQPFFATIDTANVGSNIRIQFRFEAPFGASIHDIAIDDFMIRSALGQPAVAGVAEFDISGATDSYGFPVQALIGGPFHSSISSGALLHLTVVGAPHSGCILLSGPLNPGVRTYPGIGQLDLGIPPVFPSPQGVAVIVDGISGTSLLDLIFNTGSMGTLVLDINLNVPPGSTFPLQVIVENGGSGVITLSNAVVLTTL